jgi:hypothetical protein
MVDVLTNKGTMCETQCLVRNAVPCAKRSALCHPFNVQTPYGKSKTPPFGRNINAVFPTGEH